LAVEILSPSDTQQAVDEKVQVYLKTGVQLIWIVNPVQQTITAYQPKQVPLFFTIKDSMTAPEILPGCALSMAELFE
ncbi:MAG: Uma2 family endonuclease, partial [Gemmataceae bacterium]